MPGAFDSVISQQEISKKIKVGYSQVLLPLDH